MKDLEEQKFLIDAPISEEARRHLDEIMRQIQPDLFPSEMDGKSHPLDVRMRLNELLVQIDHWKEEMRYYRRPRIMRQGGIVCLNIVRGFLVASHLKLADNYASELVNTLKEGHRFFRDREDECRRKSRDLELELKLELARLKIANGNDTNMSP